MRRPSRPRVLRLFFPEPTQPHRTSRSPDAIYIVRLNLILAYFFSTLAQRLKPATFTRLPGSYSQCFYLPILAFLSFSSSSFHFPTPSTQTIDMSRQNGAAAAVGAATGVPVQPNGNQMTKTEYARRRAQKVEDMGCLAPTPCQRCSRLNMAHCCYVKPFDPQGACSRCTLKKNQCSFTGRPSNNRRESESTAAPAQPTSSSPETPEMPVLQAPRSAWTPINQNWTYSGGSNDNGSNCNGNVRNGAGIQGVGSQGAGVAFRRIPIKFLLNED